MEPKELPVYLFTGFLESGKTTFIQESLESEEFNNKDEKTLLLCCEEGIEEYNLVRFPNRKVYIELIETPDELNADHLAELQNKYEPTRVIVEYNGMWSLDKFFTNLPPGWIVYQEMTFAYSPTYLTYNQNMRNLVFDKLQGAEIVVFNRFDKTFDKMEFHKLVRVANRKSQIIYEYERNQVEFDDIEDPLPFDITKNEINIEDIYYAYWYRDINEEPEKYQDKVISFTGRALTGGELPENAFVLGRHIMTCCVEDIQFCGLIAKMNQKEIEKLIHADWYKVKVKVKNEFSQAYGEEGPVLHVEEINHCQPLKDEVATF